MQPNDLLSQAREALGKIQKLRDASGDPGKWEANLEDSEVGESITIEADGAQIAIVMNADEFPCIDEEDVAACDARARATAVEIAALHGVSPSLLTLVSALLEEREAGNVPYRKGEGMSSYLKLERAVDAALSRFVEESRKP